MKISETILSRLSALKISAALWVVAVCFLLPFGSAAERHLLFVILSVTAALFALVGLERVRGRYPLVMATIVTAGVVGAALYLPFAVFLQVCFWSAFLVLAVSGVVLWFSWWRVSTQALDVDDGLLRFGLALPLVVMLGVFGPWQASEIVMDRAEAALLSGQTDKFYDDVNVAGRLSGERNARALLMAANVPLGIAQMNAALMPKEELEKIYQQTWDLLDRAEKQNSRLVEIQFYRAELLKYVGLFLKLEQTEEEYLRRALAVDSGYFPARLALANFLTRAKKPEEAYEIMQAGLDESQDNQGVEAYYRQMTIMAQERADPRVLGRVAESMIRREQARRQSAHGQ